MIWLWWNIIYIYMRVNIFYIYISSQTYILISKEYTQVLNKHQSNETQQRPNKTSSNKKTNAKDPKGHPNPLVRCLVEFFLPCFNKSSIVGDSFNLIQAQILAIWHTSMGAGEASAILGRELQPSSWVWWYDIYFSRELTYPPFRKRKLIFNISFPEDILVPRRVIHLGSRYLHGHTNTNKRPSIPCCRNAVGAVALSGRDPLLGNEELLMAFTNIPTGK